MTRSQDEQLPMLPWYPRDFLSATRDWTLVERAIYRELLDAQWDMGSLPNDDSALRSIVRASDDEWSAGYSTRVREKFTRQRGGRLINKRLEQHRAKSIIKMRGQQRRTDASLRARGLGKYANQNDNRAQDVQRLVVPPSPSEDSSPTLSLSLTSRSSSDKFTDVNQRDDTSAKIDSERDHWERWRATYPKRAGGDRWPKALTRWRALLLSKRATIERLQQSVERYAVYCDAEEITGSSSVLQAATFLGEERQGWLEDWSPSPTRAQRKQDRTVSALDTWLNNSSNNERSRS